MSKTTVVQLVDDLSLDQNDTITTDKYYAEVMDELAQKDWFTSVELLETTKGTSLYTIPNDTIKMLAMFYDTTSLSRETPKKLMTVFNDWRAAKGQPIAYTVVEETTKQFTLCPEPVVSSKDFSFLFGTPLGRDFPAYAVGMIQTERRQDAQAWLDLFIALRVIFKEFSYESDHQDVQFATICGQLADVMEPLL